MRSTAFRYILSLAALLTVVTALVAGSPSRKLSDSLTAAGQESLLAVPSSNSTDGIYIGGTFVATVQFEASIDGLNFFSVNATPVAGGATVTSATAGGQWLVNCAGMAYVRVRCSAWTSGTIIVSQHFGVGVAGTGSLAVSGTVAATQSGTWTVQPGNTQNTTAWLTQDGDDVPSGATRESYTSGDTNITDNTSHQIFAAQSSKHHYITQLLITNSHATVDTIVEVLDGTTPIYTGFCKAAGGGYSINFNGRPLYQPTAGAALNVKALTTGSAIQVSATGYYK